MDSKDLKDRIIAENKIGLILENLGMKHIVKHSDYYSCGMPDGDNRKSTIIYINSLNVEAFTRNIVDKFGNKDIISLVMFIKNLYFSNAIKWICDVCDFDYYGRDYQKPNILKFFEELDSMKVNLDNDIDIKLKPINENILNYYDSFVSKQFIDDGINRKTQIFYQLGLDRLTNRITIPIRDELGNLIGVKGRILDEYADNTDNKYIYLEPCNKNAILFNLNNAIDEIKRLGYVFVAESEKACMQGHSKGIKNIVSIGGHILSSKQVMKLQYLGVDIILAYDDRANIIEERIKERDGSITIIEKEDKDFYKREKSKFLNGQKVYAIIDRENKVLGYKESPFDNLDKWEELLQLKELIL